MTDEQVYGRLIIVGKEKGNDFTFVIDKTSVLLGRDPCCDIRIVNKEISRKHAEIYVDDDTSAVFILSMGREPVRVNGKPVTTAQELFTGDHIEVLLDGRSREFVFEGEDDTVEVAGARQPLGQLTNNNEIASTHRQLAACNSAAPPPAPPPPPPPPPKGKTFGTKAAAPPSPPPLPPIMKCKPEASLPLALQDAIKAGIKLRRVNKEEAGATPPKSNAAGFVPNPADLLKLKAGLRKTDAHNAMELTKQQERACDCSAEATKVQHDQAKTDAAEHEQHIIKQAAEGSEAVDDGMASLDEGPMLLASSSSAKGAQELTMPTTESEIEEEKQSEIQEPQKIELGQPMTAKKRVRWAEASTPEGAKDATMTIHLRKGELRQVINVDADNTVAFSQWALGSLEEDFEEHLPATITCKKARRDSSTTAPSSAGKTPMHSALRSLFGDEPLAVEFSPAPTCYVSDVAFNGAVAPAPTPATGAKAANPTGQSVIMNTMTLAAKLLELAQENVVTLELPTESLLVPRSALKEPCKVLLTPKSTGNSRKLPPSGTCEKSRLSQIGITEDAAKCTEVKQEISFNTVAAEETDGTPKLLSNTTWLLGGTPKSGSISNKENGHSARFSRSANRTPRVVIMERRTPTSHARCSNLKRATNSPDIAGSAINIMSQLSAGGLDAEEAAVKGEGHAHEKAACESNIQGERDGKISLKQYKKTVLKAKAYRAQAMQLQTQLRKMTMKVAKLTKAAKSVGQALEIERNRRFELQATVQQIVRNGTAAGELKHPIGEAQDGAIDISCHLSGVSGTVPQECLGVEPAICTSHPSSKVVVVRPAGHPCHDNDVGSRAERAGAVYVVRPRIEYSPAVVGVRMQQALSKKEATSTKKTPAISSRHVSSAASDMQSAKTTRSKVPATIFVKSLGKTTGHNESPLVVNDVELPQWLFPEAEKPENGIDVSAELEEAVRDAEAANLSSHDDQAHEAAAEMDLNAAALDTTATKNDQPPGDAVLAPESNFPIPDEESEEEEDALDEFCHVCGKSEEGDVLLLCDGCDNGCHLTCCNPPLKHIPKGDWFCKECFEKQQEITARSTRKSAKAAEPESIKKSAKLLEGAISKAEVPSLVKKVAEQSSKPGRGRRASVAPSTMDRGIIQEGPPRPTRSQRASVASGAAKPEVEELANASLKSSKGRRASMTTAAPQVNAKRTRGAAALNVIAEESCEENIDKKAMKGKKPRTADTKDKPAISEKTSTRTTRARATKEEDGAISVKRRRRSTQAESASVATRTTRSRR